MDSNCVHVDGVEQNMDIDDWLRDFTANADRVDEHAGIEGRTKSAIFDAERPPNVAGCSVDKSSNCGEAKADFSSGFLWNSKPKNCKPDSQQAKTSEAPVLNCALIKPSTSHNPYGIVESSMDLKTCLQSYRSQVSQPHTPHPNQLQQLLMQVSQKCNNQSFVMQPMVQHSSNQMEQWSIQPNKVQCTQPMTLQEQWKMDWLGNNNMSTLQNGLQSNQHNIAGNQQKHLPAIQQDDTISSTSQPQHSSDVPTCFSSLQARLCSLDVPHHSRPTTTVQDFLHLTSSQNLTDPSSQSSSQMMNISSILSSQNPMGHLQGKSSGFSSSTPQMKQENSSEWSDNAYRQIGSISEKSLSAAVWDIENIVNMVDMRPGALCYGDFRDPIRDDLMADVRNFIQKDKLCRHEAAGNGKMKRNINAIISNVSPTSLEESDCVDWSNYTSPHTVSMATAITKYPNTQLKSTVLEEIKETNRKLVETLVEMVVGRSEDVPRLRAEENIVIKCSYSPMGYCEKTLQQYLPSRTRFPEMLVLQLLVLDDYPNVSPIVLDKSPDLSSGEEVKCGYKEVKLRFTASLRQLSEPMSIREMAKTWDSCARRVFSEFITQQMGGGSGFSSLHGVWEECDAAAA